MLPRRFVDESVAGGLALANLEKSRVAERKSISLR